MNGIPLRFCQKCGRFQDLAGFDGLKRSCRHSLEAHNKRRRAKSARASRDKSWHDKSSVKQPLKAPQKRGNRLPAWNGNTNGTEAQPEGWRDLDFCVTELDDVFGNPLPVGADPLKVMPLSEAEPVVPSESVRSKLEGQYQTGYFEQTLALKFHGSSPSDLPKDILTDVQRHLSINPMEAFCEGTVRPGCTHVSLRVRVQEGEEADELRSLETESLANAITKTWRNETRALSKGMEVQWAGSCTHVGSNGSSFTVRAMPEISVSPSVVQSGMQVELEVLVDGIDMYGMSVAAFCRQNGKYLTTMIVPEDMDDSFEGSAEEDSEWTEEVGDVDNIEGVQDAVQMMATTQEVDVDSGLEDDTASSCGAASSRSISGRESITSHDTIERGGSGVSQESYRRVRVIGLVPGSFEMELVIDNALTAPASVLALPTSNDVADAMRLLHGATRAQETAFVRDAGMVVRHVYSPKSLLPSDLPMIQRLAAKTCEWAMERQSSHLIHILQEALHPGNAYCGDRGDFLRNAHGAALSDKIDDDHLDMTYPPDLKVLSSRLCETYELEAERAIVQELCAEISQLGVDEKRTLVDGNGWKNAVLQVVIGAALVILASSD